MNLDELVANALAEIDGMSTDELKAEFIEAGFELTPDYSQLGELLTPTTNKRILYNASYKAILSNHQTYDSFSVPCNDSNYNLEPMVA